MWAWPHARKRQTRGAMLFFLLQMTFLVPSHGADARHVSPGAAFRLLSHLLLASLLEDNAWRSGEWWSLASCPGPSGGYGASRSYIPLDAWRWQFASFITGLSTPAEPRANSPGVSLKRWSLGLHPSLRPWARRKGTGSSSHKQSHGREETRPGVDLTNSDTDEKKLDRELISQTMTQRRRN